MTLFLLCLFLWNDHPLQTTQPSSASARLEAYTARLDMEADSRLKNVTFTDIGPRVMSGRITDLLGFPDHPHTFLAAYASGGLWRSTNHSTTWNPLFEDMPAITIGDIAVVNDDPDKIWVGTGEANSSRSSYAGLGMYYTADGGKTWEHKGLEESHHISRILVHPKDPNTVLVAVIGRLYGTNLERGVFKTTDGGSTWSHVLKVNENTGVIDMAFDPSDPNRIYAAAWERSRTAWNFQEAGSGSGFYISEDGGATWSLSNEGLPAGEHMGRIGIAVSPSHPNIVYALVDNQSTSPAEPPPNRVLTRPILRDMSKDQLLALKDADIETFLRENNYHAEITAKSVRDGLKDGSLTIQDLDAYVFDGNAALFGVQVAGVELYRSDDKGKTWRRTHEEPLENLAYSYGYYFGQVRVDPANPETLYVMGVPLLASDDAGKTFRSLGAANVHVDHHAMWINPKNGNHIMLGNDGGVNITWDRGENWQHFNTLPVGQFYTVAYDMAEPYRVYGGLQDNGVWRGEARAWELGAPAWERVNGGDGAFAQIDPRDNETVYSGFQFGYYERRNMITGESQRIYPRHKLKQDPYRYNWMTPIVLSKHIPDVLYMGCQKVLRSLDKGETWHEFSPDLTHGRVAGDVPYATLTMLRESPHAFGALYAGTDDGRVWITRGDPEGWMEISKGLPEKLWVSGIEVSPHDPGTVFITLTGYRNDDFRTYVYRSDDYGVNWRDIRGNLPDEACNVIRQDLKEKGILYLGTDVGAWISFDAGSHWRPFQGGLPKVPVYAMEIHPREQELIVATHGRSIFTLDLAIIQQLKPETFEEELVVFSLPNVRFGGDAWGYEAPPWENVSERPAAAFHFYTNNGGDGGLTVSREGVKLFEEKRTFEPGVQSVSWNYRIEMPKEKKTKKQNAKKKPDWEPHIGADGLTYASAGVYKISVSLNGKVIEKDLEIKE